MNEATVVAVGQGLRTKVSGDFLFHMAETYHLFCLCFEDGEVISNNVAVGDKVLVPEYGGTKIVLEDQVSFLLAATVVFYVPGFSSF